MMFTERERLKNSLERDSGANASQQQTVAVLRQALSDVSFSQGLVLEKNSVRFSSVQGVVCVLGKALMCSTPSVSSFPNVAFENPDRLRLFWGETAGRMPCCCLGAEACTG